MRRTDEHVLYPAEHGPALLLEGANPFLIVLAVIDHAAQTLDALEALRRHGVRATENPQLLLNDRDAERSVLGDLLGELERESLDLSSGNDDVDQAMALRADGVNRPPREDHLLRHSQPGGVEQREQSADIVRHAGEARRALQCRPTAHAAQRHRAENGEGDDLHGAAD